MGHVRCRVTSTTGSPPASPVPPPAGAAPCPPGELGSDSQEELCWEAGGEVTAHMNTKRLVPSARGSNRKICWQFSALPSKTDVFVNSKQVLTGD